MKFCFLIYRYFPYGGQQRDFFKIASECLARGHEVEVYALAWQGEQPQGFNVTLAPFKTVSRLKLYRRYSDWVAEKIAKSDPDLVIGFNKMPHLDVYFAADSCFLHKAATQRGKYYKYTPRFKHFRMYEEAVFGADSKTHALVLSHLQQSQYIDYYPKCGERLHQVPPGISPDRKRDSRDPDVRISLRAELGVAENEVLLLQVGSGFRIKGVDRALHAIASLPAHWRKRTRYVLVGQGRPNEYLQLARKLGIAELVTVLPGRDDIPRFLQGADLLIHPAYMESAGYVLLEATISGLPVLTSASCGYAFHVEQAKSGEVCAEPFKQDELNTRLLGMIENLSTSGWSAKGLEYGKRAELYTLPQAAAEIIESLAAAGHTSGAYEGESL
jgi:UDP-glucose:(heptosyl)LPS alpha-1,3-glucosyltransferase